MLADPVVDRLRRTVEQIAAQARAADRRRTSSRSPSTSSSRCPAARRLSGTVASVGGGVLRAVAFSRVGPRHRLAAWVRLLALSAAQPRARLRGADDRPRAQGRPRR